MVYSLFPGKGHSFVFYFLFSVQTRLCLGKSAAVPSWAPVRLTGKGLSGGVARPLGGGRVSREASGPTAKLFSWRPLHRLPGGASTRRFSASAEAKWTCKKERMVVLGTRVLCDSDKHFPPGSQALEGLDQNHWDSNRPTSLRLPSLTKIPHHLQLLPDEQVTAICIQTGNGGALALSISHHHSSPGSPESQEGMLGAWRTHLTAGASTSLTLSRGRDPRTVFG